MENQEKTGPETEQQEQGSKLRQQLQKPAPTPPQKKERVAIFIDGSNLYHSLRRLGVKSISFEKLAQQIVQERELVAANYYTSLLDKTRDEERYLKHLEFLRELRQIKKFKVILCALRKMRDTQGNIHYEVKGDDIQLANDVVVGAYENLYDTAIIVSGDGDFVPLIRTLRRLKKKIENVYPSRSSSKRLRRACDAAINIKAYLFQQAKK